MEKLKIAICGPSQIVDEEKKLAKNIGKGLIESVGRDLLLVTGGTLGFPHEVITGTNRKASVIAYPPVDARWKALCGKAIGKLPWFGFGSLYDFIELTKGEDSRERASARIGRMLEGTPEMIAYLNLETRETYEEIRRGGGLGIKRRVLVNMDNYSQIEDTLGAQSLLEGVELYKDIDGLISDLTNGVKNGKR